MKSFAERLAEDIRLEILKALQQDTDYSMNDRILQGALEQVGHADVSRDRLRTELYWLQEQGLLNVTDVGTLIAKITQRGSDVANGRTNAPGVARKGPEDQ